jgi:hypothetical protein
VHSRSLCAIEQLDRMRVRQARDSIDSDDNILATQARTMREVLGFDAFDEYANGRRLPVSARQTPVAGAVGYTRTHTAKKETRGTGRGEFGGRGRGGGGVLSVAALLSVVERRGRRGCVRRTDADDVDPKVVNGKGASVVGVTLLRWTRGGRRAIGAQRRESTTGTTRGVE